MKTLALLTLALALTLVASRAADNPAADYFPKVGETYKIAAAASLAEAPLDNIVTVLAVSVNQWVKVQYQTMTRAGKEKREMWVNFANISSAVPQAPGK